MEKVVTLISDAKFQKIQCKGRIVFHSGSQRPSTNIEEFHDMNIIDIHTSEVHNYKRIDKDGEIVNENYAFDKDISDVFDKLTGSHKHEIRELEEEISRKSLEIYKIKKMTIFEIVKERLLEKLKSVKAKL